MSKRDLRPMAEIYNPVPIAAADVVAVGTISGVTWHASLNITLCGDPPVGAEPKHTDYDFGEKWMNGRTFTPMKPTGWFSSDRGNADGETRGAGGVSLRRSPTSMCRVTAETSRPSATTGSPMPAAPACGRYATMVRSSPAETRTAGWWRWCHR